MITLIIIISLIFAVLLCISICFFKNKLKINNAIVNEIEKLAKMGHWQLNVKKNELYWSDEIFHIFDIDKKDFKESYEEFLSFVHPDDREFVDTTYRTALKNKTQYDIVHKIQLRDGRIKFVNDRCVTTYTKSGKPQVSIGTVQDITELHMAQIEKEKAEKQLRQSQKLEALGNLASGIAHDFNNILTPITGFTEIVMDELPEDSENYKSLENVLNASSRAKDLVAQILAFSRQKEEKLIPIYLSTIVKEVIKLLSSSIPANIDLESDIKENCPPVLADPTQIHQILMNLCTNAHHAIGDKNGRITIALSEKYISSEDLVSFPELKEGNYVNLVISDNGDGIKKENLERIFEPYFTTKKEGKGTGLGLSVVHGIIKNYDGIIKVYSDISKGTSFSIFIPGVEANGKSPDKNIIFPPLGNEKIVLIDDDLLITEGTKMILERLGYDVSEFNDPINAYEYITINYLDIDLIITDLTMPYMTGLQLCSLIYQHGIDIPVMISTGFSEKLTDDEIQETNIACTIMKPIIKSEIADKIRTIIDNSKTEKP